MNENDTPEEKEEIKQEILSQIDDTTLCEELYGETLSRCGEIYDKDFEEKFYNLNEYQREFFVVQGLNQYMSEGGVGLYLVDSRGLFITDLANTLDKFELSEFSDLWRNFMDRPDIDWDALIKEVREYDDWDETELLESIYGKYP